MSRLKATDEAEILSQVDASLATSEDGYVWGEDLADAMGLRPGTVREYLNRLTEWGYLERYKVSRRIVYSRTDRDADDL